MPDLTIRCPQTWKILLLIEVWDSHPVSAMKLVRSAWPRSPGSRSRRGTLSLGVAAARYLFSTVAAPASRTLLTKERSRLPSAEGCPLQTGCSWSISAAECQLSPIADVGRHRRQLFAVARNLPFNGGGAMDDSIACR